MFYIILSIYIFVLTYPFWRATFTPLFHPLKITCLFYSFYTIPFLFFAAFGNIKIFHEYVYRRYVLILDDLLVEYVTLQTIGIACLYLGINMVSNKKLVISKYLSFKVRENHSNDLRLFYILFLSSVSFFLYLVSVLGGFEKVLLESYVDPDFLSGYGHIILFVNSCLFLSAISLMKYMSYNRIHKALIILIYIGYFIMLSIFGGRSNFVLLILVTFFSLSIFNDKFRIFSFKNVIFGSILLIYFIIAPALRGENILSKNIEYFDIIFDNLILLSKGNEYVNIQLSILGYFDYTNLWLGSSYMDLFYSFLPSSMYNDKPPVEEGVYYFNIIKGHVHSPPFPARKMILVGWPPGTMGVMFSNFHVVGIILGYFILGRIYKLVYSLMINSNFNITLVYLYLFVLLKFELTNHYIFHTISLILSLSVLAFMQKIFLK